MNKERNRFKKPTGEKHDKAFTDKWFAYLNGDSKAKEGVTYKNVFLDDFEKMDKTKKYIDAIKRDRKKPSAKKNGRDVNVTSPVGDDKPETDEAMKSMSERKLVTLKNPLLTGNFKKVRRTSLGLGKNAESSKHIIHRFFCRE